MAKTWYPVIDTVRCMECGACVDMCQHGAFDRTKAPSPVVWNPEACIDHCHGCGNRCPAGAIVYLGEDSGWTPPHGPQEVGAICSRPFGTDAGKIVLVEYLYLDLKSCDRCIGADAVLDEVMLFLAPVLLLAGYHVEYKKREMQTAETAAQYRFRSSPTIRVNGRDIGGPIEENRCGCCSAISGTDVACRLFSYQGESFEVPPKEMLAEGILRAVFGPAENKCDCGGEYRLPENLRAFYAGKKKLADGHCG
jgi:NAD-dependent dihydropyrimidine dehydrogenase PreA subunit/glutaredoxin